MEEKIMTRHPQGKQGSRISLVKYEMIKSAILGTLDAGGEVAFADLVTALHAHLHERFDGSITWYAVTVKLDLEARGLITRAQRDGRQYIRRTAS